MTYYFCTYFDINYLPRGLALYTSLKRHCRNPFVLWVLCMDDETYQVLAHMALSEVRPVSLAEFESGDDELVAAKSTRSKVEYYFTCTPSLPLWVLNNHPEVDLITYLDADLYFFADPMPIFEEMGTDSILAIEHRFPPHQRRKEVCGVFNVGFLSFRRNDEGLGCLRWWRDRCIEWCYDRVEETRFADQKYLDQWPRLFLSLTVLQHRGAGLAPWNLANYEIRCSDGQVTVDGEPLIFYHFHGLKAEGHWFYATRVEGYGARLQYATRAGLYRPYVSAVVRASRLVGRYRAERGDVFATIRGGIAARRPRSPLRSRASELLRAARAPRRTVRRLRRGEALLLTGRWAW